MENKVDWLHFLVIIVLIANIIIMAWNITNNNPIATAINAIAVGFMIHGLIRYGE